MTELEAKINKLESLLTSVQSQLERLATKGHGRQKRKSRSRPLRTPEWEAITKAFSELRRDVEDIKKTLSSQESDTHSQMNGWTPSQDQSGRIRDVGTRLWPSLTMSQESTHPSKQVNAFREGTSCEKSNSRPVSPASLEADSEVISASPLTSATSDGANSPVFAHRQVQTISVADMGDNLVGNLSKFALSDSFSNIITIEDLYQVEWKDVAKLLDIQQGYAHLFVTYKPVDVMPACTMLVKDISRQRPRQFKFPDPSTPINRPSLHDISKYLEQTVKDPPESSLTYYVGPRLTTCFDHLLHSGPELSKLDNIAGVNSVYDHLGERGSGTAFHHEDARLWSCNLTLFGWKAWILIREHHTAKFEDFVRTKWPDKCDQFVRHCCLLFAPSSLRDRGIEFDIRCTGPGDLLVTKPRQYHAVINFTNSYAISTNFLPPGEDAIPPGLRVCSECGLRNLYKQVKMAKPKATPVNKRVSIHQAVSEVSEHRVSPNHLQELKCKKNAKESVNSVCTTPIEDPNGHQHDQVLKLVAAMQSRSALLQFCSMVKASRAQSSSRSFKNTNSYEERLVQCVTNLNISETDSDVQKLRVRLDQIRLVDHLENSRTGQLRCSSEVKQRVLRAVNWPEAKLEGHQKKGSKWRKVRGTFTGILCFIFPQRGNPDKIKQKDYLDLANNPKLLAAFHDLLRNDYTQTMCAAGEAFEDSLTGGSLAQFRWEAENVDIWSLPEEEILPYMAPTCHSHVRGEASP
ncbi:hypothetical protein H634G_10663 [Metarhizium anisopliae BRIP 53293]|uniref:JmjC domain-containing protein n=1 Tax=Metarhizium anisopliae BRIP 53293 TaxID=1291518 RepID=A0A0D9NJC2_METAN|nr:hypothetical protein H634G_10663 [Metarhizium anisopliae BRIP 53293]